MLTTKEFLEAVCQASGPVSYTVTVDGLTTRAERVLTAPDQARKFTGETITITEVVQWGDAMSDGSRSGDVVITTTGVPVTLKGTAQLAPGGRGTTVHYQGDFKVNIPLIGKKLEKEAAPTVTEALAIQQRVGDEWLASH